MKKPFAKKKDTQQTYLIALVLAVFLVLLIGMTASVAFNRTYQISPEFKAVRTTSSPTGNTARMLTSAEFQKLIEKTIKPAGGTQELFTKGISGG